MTYMQVNPTEQVLSGNMGASNNWKQTVQHHGLGEGCLLAADGVTVHKEMLYERVMQKKPEVCYSTTGKPAAIWNKLL